MMFRDVEAIRSVQGDLSRQKEERIRDTIALRVQVPYRVRIEKPRWMPEWVFRKILRTIVVQEGPMKIEVDR